ncbi:S-adenosylmethionine:tRNA ribosyltransferase-isomerase [Ectobacillus ponti]|uniref:S-adenosylmethionine:tRNA ribosyltransferase-isomerase n=1 Tax=Ectobacillus ponti TaxID=2961894 RepID=A0AA41X627_9BACI|nr:S-adenosylmethionine:tRNA ribosyltransferase-isomerase [Ectobacillus ponti]MCP8969614.1 S-adenosylmethionine:tRNA ribosyltransferase-isomerase [Ectobacillus ponti]
MATSTSMDFWLPDELNAAAPAERRGIRRDHVKLLVLDRKSGEVSHDIFYNLEQYLSPGDVIVLNNSRTLPAILKAQDGTELRLARRIDSRTWDVLLVSDRVKQGDTFFFSNTLSATVTGDECDSPITRVMFSKEGTALLEELYALGEPVRYEYIQEPWGLEYYQTVFASKPGSVEMPSAGRAFSWQLLKRLQQKGVKIAYMQLHTGLSYFLDDKWEHSPEDNLEEYDIPVETMQEVQRAKEHGHKVIAVGTTVVRALETAAKTNALSGWTNLYITGDYQLQVADAIITGMHEPKASHLDMLCAFVAPNHLFNAYGLAIQERYLWHEFGDMNLIV